MRESDVAEQMRRDWDARALENAKFYINCALWNQEDAEFDQSAPDILRPQKVLQSIHRNDLKSPALLYLEWLGEQAVGSLRSSNLYRVQLRASRA